MKIIDKREERPCGTLASLPVLTCFQVEDDANIYLKTCGSMKFGEILCVDLTTGFTRSFHMAQKVYAVESELVLLS